MAVRWNTGYYMIERINEQKIAIQQLLKDDDIETVFNNRRINS
jgi:hypothetical protein